MEKNDGDFSVKEIEWVARLSFVYSKLNEKFFNNIGIGSGDFSEYYHVLNNHGDQLYTIEDIPFYKFLAKNFISFVFTLMDQDKFYFSSLFFKLDFRLKCLIKMNKSKFSFKDLCGEGFKINPEKMEKIVNYWNMQSQWNRAKKIYPKF